MLRTLQYIEKRAIGATDGDIRHVKDLYFDDHTWVIRYFVVGTGSWLSSRKVLIAPITIHKPDWAAHRLPVAITRGQTKNSPDIDTEPPAPRQHEVQTLGCYGYPMYWGGVGMWGGGMVPTALFPGYAALPGGTDERKQTLRTAPGPNAPDTATMMRICATAMP